MNELVKANTGTLEDLAPRINAEHRACEAAAATAVEHAIRCGELLLEAKQSKKHGGWMSWLADNFEGSQDLANKYMRVARNSERVMNLARDGRSISLRGALDELKTADREKRELEVKERNRRAKEHFGETRRQAAVQADGGYPSMALRMEASHSYDFERPGEPVRFAACERLWHTGFLSGFVDWNSETNVFFEDEVPVLQPTEAEFIAARHRRGPTFHRFNPDFAVQEPTLRALSWDGSKLLLPTGHWEAAHYKGEIRRWWEWDVLPESCSREIQKSADRKQYKAGWLQTEALIGGLSNGPWKWLPSKELEAALAKDLEAVRAQLSADKPDLTDPRVVYEIGERVLVDYDKRKRAWKRFAAFVESGGAA